MFPSKQFIVLLLFWGNIFLIKAQDIPAIDTAIAELNAAWTAASQDMYNSTQQDGGTQQQPGAEQANTDGKGAGAKADDNVTDVPYEEVK